MTSIHKYYTTAIHTALLTVLILCVGSCSSDDPEVAQSPNDAYWKVSSTVSSSEGSSAIIITGIAIWLIAGKSRGKNKQTDGKKDKKCIPTDADTAPLCHASSKEADINEKQRDSDDDI